MHFLAITALGLPAEDALPELAAALGTTPYDLRIALNAGVPSIVLVADDAVQATRAAEKIRKLGHGAEAVDRRAVTPSAGMQRIRQIRFEPRGMVPTESARQMLAYPDILCLLRATHRSTSEAVQEVKERSFRPGMAVATGGLVLTKKTTREVRTRREQQQQVLYVFPRSGGPAWILREREADYFGLGSEMQPAAMGNFQAAIRRLRALAPDAHYDESLLRPRPVRGAADPIEVVDACAHALAAHWAR